MSAGTNLAKLPKESRAAFILEFHSSFATFPASKAYSVPGTGGLFAASPLVTIVAHTTPVPGVSPLAESARMPPGQIAPTELWALGEVAKVVPLNAKDLSASSTPQSYSRGPPWALERSQYTGPPRNSLREIC